MSEVKLQLKKLILNYNKKPIKFVENLVNLQEQNPTFTQKQLIEICPDMTFGNMLPNLLLSVPSKDPVEKLKLFRWAGKIEDKMISVKAELTLDMNQVIELYGYIGRVQNFNIITIASILIHLEELKEKLGESK